MKIVIIDEKERSGSGDFAISNDEMRKVLDLLDSFGCDISLSAQQSVEPTSDHAGFTTLNGVYIAPSDTIPF